MNIRQQLTTLLAVPTACICNVTLAADDDTLLYYSLEPRFFNTRFTPSDKHQLTEASMDSGLGLTLQNEMVNVSIDYNLQGRLFNAADMEQSNLSQMLTASMRSTPLNNLLAVNAAINSTSRIDEGGDIFRYDFVPRFSKPLQDLARLDVSYTYILDKNVRANFAFEIQSYSLGLNGDLADGRLTWNSGYSETSQNNLLDSFQHENTEVIDFRSRYRLVEYMHLEVSGTITDRKLFSAMESPAFSEKLIGAGIAWSPSGQYSLSLRLNKSDRIDANRFDQQDYFTSGNVTWLPSNKLEFSLGYGDQLLEGARGMLLTSTIDLDDS